MTPTKPGWWWVDGIADPVWIAIDPDKGPTYGGMALDATRLTLLAEVPGPAVSVAVARRIAAEAALAKVKHLAHSAEWDEWDLAVDSLASLLKAEAQS